VTVGRGFRIPVAILALAILGVGLLVVLRPGRRHGTPGSPRPSAAPPASEAGKLPPSGPAAAPVPPAPAPRPRTAFDRLLEALRRGDRAAALAALEDLRLAFAPSPVPDAENAAALYRKAFELYKEGPTDEEAELMARLSEGEPLTASERAVLEKVVEKNREALALLHQAAALARCDFGVDYTRGVAADLPHVAGMIRASKLLEIEALLGSGPEAARSARASLRLSEAVADEPILVSQLVRGVCGEMARESWQQAFRGEVEAEALRTLLDSVSGERYREGYEKSLLFELYGGAKYVLEGWDLSALGPEGAKLRPSGDPLTAEDLAYYAETMAEVSALAGRPYYEIRDRLAALRAERVDGAPWYAEITRLVMPAFERAAMRQAQAEAGAGTGRLAAALRLYRERNGSYPESLGSLRGILPDPPVDPFTGSPFRYRREGEGFVVWSPGEDGRDDGGVSAANDVLFRSPR